MCTKNLHPSGFKLLWGLEHFWKALVCLFSTRPGQPEAPTLAKQLDQQIRQKTRDQKKLDWCVVDLPKLRRPYSGSKKPFFSVEEVAIVKCGHTGAQVEEQMGLEVDPFSYLERGW